MTNPTPSRNQVKSKSFVTYRRLWLDACLENFAAEMRGTVLDLGGKRENKRGSFQPPEKSANGWWYFNLDMVTKPDAYADVRAVPIKTESIDIAICTEVLEHLENPAACCQEIHRILKKGGKAFISTPFMYPVHADPYDFQRFTADGLKSFLASFQSVQIYPMGGYLGSLAMLMEIGLPGIAGMQLSRRALRRGLGWFAKRLYIEDLKLVDTQPAVWSKFTTGYFAKAVK